MTSPHGHRLLKLSPTTSPHGHRLLKLSPTTSHHGRLLLMLLLPLPPPPLDPRSHRGRLLLALRLPLGVPPSQHGRHYRLLAHACLPWVMALSRPPAPELRLPPSPPGQVPQLGLVPAASARSLQTLAPSATPGRLGPPRIPSRKARLAVVTAVVVNPAPSSTTTSTPTSSSSACPSPTMQHRHRQRKTTLRLLLRATTLP